MFKIPTLFSKQRQIWRVSTKGGVMVRECSRTGRLQYRDCATARWVDVEDREALTRVVEELQEVSHQTPAWVYSKTADPEKPE